MRCGGMGRRGMGRDGVGEDGKGRMNRLQELAYDESFWRKEMIGRSDSSYSNSAMTPMPDIPPWEPGGYSKTFELWMAEEKKIGANSRSYLDGYLHHATVTGQPGELHPKWPKEYTELIRKSVKKSRVLAHTDTTYKGPQTGTYLKKWFGGADNHGPRERHKTGYYGATWNGP